MKNYTEKELEIITSNATQVEFLRGIEVARFTGNASKGFERERYASWWNRS